MEQRSKEWFEARKKRLTASNVGAVLGLDPFRDRDDVMRTMVREALGAEPEFAGNVATVYGQYHEAGALVDFQMETGLDVEKCGFYPYEDWLGASPDGLIGEGALLEIKCPFGLRNEDDPQFKTLDEQPHYYAQTQIQMYCTGRSMVYFYQWTPYGTFIERKHLDKIWLNENLPILKQFYAEFLHELEHNADEHLAPKRIKIDTPQAHRMIQEWDELKEQIELAQERQKDLLAEIVALSKDKDALIAGRKLTKVERAGSVSFSKVVKEKLPDLDLTPWTGKPTSYWKLT